MIHIKEVTEDNFGAVINLKVKEDQRTYVAPNVHSLAQCYIYRQNNDVFPYAIYNDDEVVGFVLLEAEDDNEYGLIWRLMIGDKYQGKGYGKEVVKLCIQYFKDLNRYKGIKLDYVIGNTAAEKLYKSMGFVPTGEVEDNEVVLMLEF